MRDKLCYINILTIKISRIALLGKLSCDFCQGRSSLLGVATLGELIAAIKGRVVPPLAFNQLADQATGTLIEFLPIDGLKPDFVAGDLAKLANVA